MNDRKEWKVCEDVWKSRKTYIDSILTLLAQWNSLSWLGLSWVKRLAAWLCLLQYTFRALSRGRGNVHNLHGPESVSSRRYGTDLRFHLTACRRMLRIEFVLGRHTG